MRFLAVLLVAVVVAQKNATQKPTGKEWVAKIAPKAGPNPNATAHPKPDPKPEPNATAPPAKGGKAAPEPDPNPIPAELRAAWGACQVAYPNALRYNDTEDFLIQANHFLTNKPGPIGVGPNNLTTTGARAIYDQWLSYTNLLCQIGFRLKQENPAGKCSELCNLDSTSESALWSTYRLVHGSVKFYYAGSPNTYTQQIEPGLFSVQSTWQLATFAEFANSPVYDAHLTLADPSILGTCMIGCQMGSDYKAAKPAAGNGPVNGKQVGLGVGVGAGGLILLAGVGSVVARRLNKNKKAAAPKTPESVVAI